MSVQTQNSSARSACKAVAILAFFSGLAGTAFPAAAATWGHLRSPFSNESQLRQRADYAAEARDEQCRQMAAARLVDCAWRHAARSIQGDDCITPGRGPQRLD